MKTLLIGVAVIALGCSGMSGSGASGSNGSNGSNGADGKDGSPGADGKDGAPGAPGKDAAMGGARLRPRWRNAEDGAREFVGFYDSDLQINCGFALAADGKERCLPSLTEANYQKAYSDAQCSVVVYVIQASSEACFHAGYVFESGPPGCPFSPVFVGRKLGASLDAAAPYYSTMGGSCAALPAGAVKSAFAAGEVVDPSVFVGSAVETGP